MPSLRNWLRSRLAGKPTKPTRRAWTRTRPCLEQLEAREVPSTIHGSVFEDVNRDGVQDPGEAGLPGWTVYLDVNRNSVLDSGEAFTVTDANGAYSLDTTNEPPSQVGSTSGTIRDYLAVVLSVGEGGRWINTTSTFAAINRNTEPDAERNFGVYFQPFVGTNPVAAETRVNETAAGVQDASRVAADANGNYVVAWQSTGADGTKSIRARLFNANGTARTGELVVATEKSLTLDGVAMSGDGNRVIFTWGVANPNFGTGNLFCRVYTGTGAEVTAGAVLIRSGSATTSARPEGVATDANGDFVVLYGESAYVKPKGTTLGYWKNPTYFVQRYTQDGAAIGSRLNIATPNVIGTDVAKIASDAAGNFVVSWYQGDGNLFAQRFGSDGRKIGRVITVAIDGYAATHHLVMNASGKFAVAYGVVGQGVFVQVFNPTGTMAGDRIALGIGLVDGLAIDDAGNMVFTWTDSRQPTAGTTYPYTLGEVRYRRLTADGVLEPEQIVNTTTEGEQSESSVAMSGNGIFVIVWQGYGLDDESGIYTQLLASM